MHYKKERTKRRKKERKKEEERKKERKKERKRKKEERKKERRKRKKRKKEKHRNNTKPILISLFLLKLEVELKERIQNTGALTLKILFKNNHPDGKPLVNR